VLEPVIIRVSRQRMHPSDKWENLAEILRAIEPGLEIKLAYCRANFPDPVKKPVTNAVVMTYISCVELELAAIRGGSNGLKSQSLERPGLMREILEIESWILRRKSGVARAKFSFNDEEALGDWFVGKMGYSYSEAKRMIQELRDLSSGRGAPNKRPETLKLMDARISNKWSYKQLASQMCHCGSRGHNEHCVDRLRKRLKECEMFLAKYKISYLPM
jgi:hypothetical protein